MGISAVQARTVELQGLIESLTPTRSAAQATTATSVESASTGTAPENGEFSSVLAEALSASQSPAASAPASSAVAATAQTAADGSLTIGGLSLTEFAKAQVTPGSGMELVQRGMKYLGTPYVWGGSSPSGFDCSGFTSYVLKEMGVTVPRTARQQGTVGTEVASLDQARPGDLLILNGGTHVGIYIGGDQYMHAPRPGEKVKIGKIYGDIDTIRRVVPAGEVLTAAMPAAAPATVSAGVPAALASVSLASVSPSSGNYSAGDYSAGNSSTLATDAALGRALLNALTSSGQIPTTSFAGMSGFSGTSGLNPLMGLDATGLATLASANLLGSGSGSRTDLSSLLALGGTL
ncbi:C40 family peptidase [Actinomycetaceae bacterium L2_0104]